MRRWWPATVVCLALGSCGGLWSCQFPEYHAPTQAGGAAGAGGAATGGDVSGGGGAASECEQPDACVAVPAGWLGPIAFWDSKSSGQQPPCPEGYESPRDLHAEPSTDDATCSCTCDALGESCAGVTEVALYYDLTCQTLCAHATPNECNSIAGCTGNKGSMRALVAAPANGSCTANVTKGGPQAVWQRDARFCELSRTERGSCASAGQQCVPTPDMPFASQVCVYRVVLEGDPLPTCPAGYERPDVLYSELTDQRGCGPCECAGPSGGRCEGKVIISDGEECSSGFEYEIGSGCQPYSLGESASLALVAPVLSPGSCTVAAEPVPSGTVTPTGNATIVCCP